MSPHNILDLFNAKAIDKDWSFEEYTFSQTGKWTHDYHRYPAKFIPQLVEKLIHEYVDSSDAHINDPFLGCGTTIVTAISKGFKASGTDINKIAHLIAKVKATPIEPDFLEEKISTFFNSLKFIQEDKVSNQNIKPLIPENHLERIDYWFNEKNRDILGIILRIISEHGDDIIRDFLLVAFSNILKNCSIWLQTSTKPTRDLKKTPTHPYPMLKRQLNKMLRGNKDFFNIVPGNTKRSIQDYLNIKISDAKFQPADDNTVDLIVSSSPYVTSYEYADLHQLSTIWLDLAESLTDYRKEFIGTAYKNYENRNVSSEIAQTIIEDMQSKSKKMAKEIEAFFLDMEDVFKESYRILKPGGRCCYVIGNTKLKQVSILNAEVFAESLINVGFKFDRIIKREIPSKILPQNRDEATGKFASNDKADSQAYPIEYIVIGLKE